jgi:hypothetical protein
MEFLADIPVLSVTSEVLDLADAPVADGPIPRKASADASHIATATVYGCNYLLTWICSQIANAEIRRSARNIAGAYGYELPVICTPEELMGGDYEHETLEG